MMKLDSIKPDPVSNEEKATQVQRIFDTIAPIYDRANVLLSFGLARQWRKQAVASFHDDPPGEVLDVACGTGDLVKAVLTASPSSVVIGLDFSEEMLRQARAKLPGATFVQGDVLALPFDANRFDAVTVGFGLRNFVDIPKALVEMARVLKSSGRLIILEATHPGTRLKQGLFNAYRKSVAPLVGWLTGHPNAYGYLMRSMQAMPSSEELENLLAAAGFTAIRKTGIVFDMCVCYHAIRQTDLFCN
jgi:demethylmenaquinone methyltransferase/2-methoxy-6-polyprenyl-1,4-benzoquinol methylase